jgi:arabinofuranan 3-O-arabinosyltransferase
VLLALLGVLAWRRRAAASVSAGDEDPAPAPAPLPLADPPPAAPRPLVGAVAIAIPAAVVVAGLFGLRAGAVAAPLLALVLWRGLSDRVLGLVVLGLLGVVVPLIYVGVAVFGEEIRGGNATRYAADRLAAHWVAVAAFVVLVVVLVRTLAAARSRDRLPSRT